MNSDRLTALLHRFMADRGPEGANAFEMFCKQAEGRIEKVVILDDKDGDPLWFVVNNLKAKLAEAEQEIEHLRSVLSTPGATPPRGNRSGAFPWESYPEIEQRAFEMIFIEGVPMSAVKSYIVDNAPEAEGNSTFLNQRFLHGRPTGAMIVEVRQDDSDITWSEIWRICSVRAADNWIKRALRVGGGLAKFCEDGKVPHNWQALNPNDFIGKRGRKKLRSMFHSNSFPTATEDFINLIEASGGRGITSAELRLQGAEWRRRNELQKQSIIFEDDGRWYHHTRATLFPNNTAAQFCVLKHGVGSEVPQPTKRRGRRPHALGV